MKIKEKYYRFAEKGQQIQRVNRFFVTEYLIFYAFILFMLWASRAKGVRSLGFAAFVSVIAVVSGGALLIRRALSVFWDWLLLSAVFCFLIRSIPESAASVILY